MKTSDFQLIKEIKEKVQNLPDLQIPPENAYIILEVDGCMTGWGGIAKWKPKKMDSKGTEVICAYASGKFSTPQSVIDAEIQACINTLEKLKIYYLDKLEISLRTDCQAIISFHNKTNSNKASRVRWLKFVDALTGTGVQIHIEHIDGKLNVLADTLSRLVKVCISGCTEPMQESMILVQEAVQEIQDEYQHGMLQSKGQNASDRCMRISDLCQKMFTGHSAFMMTPQTVTEQSKDSYIPSQSEMMNATASNAKPFQWKLGPPDQPIQPYKNSKRLSNSKPKSDMDGPKPNLMHTPKTSSQNYKPKTLKHELFKPSWNDWLNESESKSCNEAQDEIRAQQQPKYLPDVYKYKYGNTVWMVDKEMHEQQLRQQRSRY